MRQLTKRSGANALLFGCVLGTGLMTFTGATAVASDAASQLADRFSGPTGEVLSSEARPAKRPPPQSETTSLEAKRVTATKPSEDSADRVDAFLDRLRNRLEATKIQKTEPASKAVVPGGPAAIPPSVPATRNVGRRTTPDGAAPQHERLVGNELFGDDTRSRRSTANTNGRERWARPSMKRHGATLDAAPERPPGPIERVTVLLVMKPGNRGIRRFQKTADPILCLGRQCAISRGPNDKARMMRRGKAFGTINTLGKRAGACKNKLICVFRDVRFEDGEAEIQPIDLRIMRHDRREKRMAKADRTCGVFRGRLTCGRPIEAETYTVWIIPEDVAVEAGVRVLEKALHLGLQASRSAALR